MNFYGSGKIKKTWKKRCKNGYNHFAIVEDASQSELKIMFWTKFKTPQNTQAKVLFVEDKNIYFNGLLDADAVIIISECRPTLESLKFYVTSDYEEIYSFQSSGLHLDISIKAPKFNFFGRCTQLLAKARDSEVLRRLQNILKSHICLQGYMTHGHIVLTSLDEAKIKRICHD